MPRNRVNGNLALAGYNDIFKIGEVRADESIIEMPLADLFPPEFHPFQVNDDEAMDRLVISIKKYGVRDPGVVRPRSAGGFELLCGNRRRRACELAKLATLPVRVRELDDEQAVLIMVDSNLEHRERILPSERAWAYKIMMEALNHNGVKGESHSYEVMVERTGIKKSQLFRIIRLTNLVADLADKVDKNQLAFNPAVELSYLTIPEQTDVAKAMAVYDVKPSLSQAQRLRKLKSGGELTPEAVDTIISEMKKPPKTEATIAERYREFFPSGFSQSQMDKVIVELLSDWRTRMAV